MTALDFSSARWRKSSHSSMDENSTCVEVAALTVDPSSTDWRKSRHSSEGQSLCVEIAALTIDRSPDEWHKSSHSSMDENSQCVEVTASGVAVAVRDSKDPDGPYLTFTPRAWRALAERIEQGRLDPA